MYSGKKTAMLFKFLKRILSKKDNVPVRLLPPSVSYALGNEQGLMGKGQILSLVEYGFWREAFYLLVRQKSSILDPYQMAELLKNLMSSLLNSPDSLRKSLVELAMSMGKDSTSGVKLAQVSRQGFDLWYEMYEKRADSYLKNKNVPTVLAFAPLIGINSFIRLHRFNIIDMKLIDSDNDIIGYKIFIYHETKEVRIDFMYKKDGHFGFFIDDVQKTGKKLSDLKKYAKEHNWKFKFEAMSSNVPAKA